MRRDDMALRAHYEQDGFAVVDQPVIDLALIERAVARMNAMAGGIYDRPGRPYRRWNVGHPTMIQKIDNAHLADQTLFELVSHPAIGQLVAAVTGARWVQVWSSQLLYKPAHSGQDGCVGWHRDKQYWGCWSGTLMTVTVALSELSAHNGAVSFVRGSHRWPEADVHGDAYRQDLAAQRADAAAVFGQPWEEAVMQTPAGGLCIHHAQVIHGSAANHGHEPRRSIAINLRTEDTAPIAGMPDFGMWDCLLRPEDFPVVFEAA